MILLRQRCADLIHHAGVALVEYSQKTLQHLAVAICPGERCGEVETLQGGGKSRRWRDGVSRRSHVDGDGVSRHGPVAGDTLRPASQHRVENVGQDGLGEDVVHAGSQYPFPFLDHGVCGQGNDRQIGPAGADDAGSGVAIHHRHLEIHQYQVVSTGLNGGHCQGTVVGGGDGGAGYPDEFLTDLPVEFVVVDQQDVGAGQAGNHCRLDGNRWQHGMAAQHTDHGVVQG